MPTFVKGAARSDGGFRSKMMRSLVKTPRSLTLAAAFAETVDKPLFVAPRLDRGVHKMASERCR